MLKRNLTIKEKKNVRNGFIFAAIAFLLWFIIHNRQEEGKPVPPRPNIVKSILFVAGMVAIIIIAVFFAMIMPIWWALLMLATVVFLAFKAIQSFLFPIYDGPPVELGNSLPIVASTNRANSTLSDSPLDIPEPVNNNILA